MNCVIISTKHGTYQITNDSLADDKFFNGADTSAPQEFLNNLFENKELGGNYTVKKWSGSNWSAEDIPVQKFLVDLNRLLEADIEKEIYGYDQTISTVSFKDLADHLIGNKQIPDTNCGKNLWYNKHMGGSSLYAFSKNRGVVMSGVFNEKVHKFWFKLYEELRAEQVSNSKTRPVTNFIDKLFPGDLDIFEKLTILVNNNQRTLVEKLGNRYIKNTKLTEGSAETKKALRESSDNYVGCALTVGTSTYIIPQNAVKNSNNDVVFLHNIDTNKTESVDIKTIIGSIYLPVKVKLGRTEFYKIKNDWYGVKGNNFKKVTDSKKISEIFQTLNSTLSDTIVVSSRPLNNTIVFRNSSADPLFSISPIGTQIKVKNEWIIKTAEDEWQDANGNTFKGPGTVDAVRFPDVEEGDNNIRVLLAKQQLLPVQTVYTKNELTRMLNNTYGDIANYEVEDGTKNRFVFNPMQKHSVKFESDEHNNIWISISLKPSVMQSPMYTTDIVRACEFLLDMNNNETLEKAVSDRLAKKISPRKIYQEYISKGIAEYGIKSELTWDEISKREQNFTDSVEIDESAKTNVNLQEVIDRMIASGDWNELCEVGS